ncbi:hypothetical protein Lalb_Chr15g0085351 [Lupinus albus]|uniref:Uncharacterized protein n=1 Tax=Lupinus albus TaxID=3870 RepID=A0A6A4PDW2_LUPAL|nr:hypothetical protein Lalb_Chr15g0085351 [Lupinus albus]
MHNYNYNIMVLCVSTMTIIVVTLAAFFHNCGKYNITATAMKQIKILDTTLRPCHVMTIYEAMFNYLHPLLTL